MVILKYVKYSGASEGLNKSVFLQTIYSCLSFSNSGNSSSGMFYFTYKWDCFNDTEHFAWSLQPSQIITERSDRLNATHRKQSHSLTLVSSSPVYSFMTSHHRSLNKNEYAKSALRSTKLISVQRLSQRHISRVGAVVTRGSHHDIVSLHLCLFTGQLLTLQLQTERRNTNTQFTQISSTSSY